VGLAGDEFNEWDNSITWQVNPSVEFSLGHIYLDNVDYTDPAYVTVGAAINKAILAAFGDPSGVEIPHLNADVFNEMEPTNSTLEYLALCNSNMYASMTAADPRAVYVMQGWLFLEGFWTYERRYNLFQRVYGYCRIICAHHRSVGSVCFCNSARILNFHVFRRSE
jgi:hypothetical protein